MGKHHNQMRKHHHHHGHKSRLVLSVLLIALGVLFAIGNLGIMPYNFNKIILSWQMVVIIIGIITIFNKHIFSGLFITSIGAFFILPRFAMVFPETFSWAAEGFVSTYWPFWLIFIGLLGLLHWVVKPSNSYKDCHSEEFEKKTVHQGGLNKNSVFGNGEHIILDPEFLGGELNAIFGGITLDLRKTNLPEGETSLEMNAVFGGIVIHVPDSWNIEVHVDAIFGGINDERNINGEIDHSRKLIIHGSCIFGGGELKN